MRERIYSVIQPLVNTTLLIHRNTLTSVLYTCDQFRLCRGLEEAERRVDHNPRRTSLACEVARQRALAAFHITVLPTIGCIEKSGPAFFSFASEFALDGAGPVVIVNVEYVHGVCEREFLIARDNRHIFVV